ncbi:RDD family protein [Nocardioides sp.]|uniref:RDD family protein n=1 Tax=Nocardioides sp. TaxID=35761 RepID=UPI002CA218E8|nr:RDD family protein [Nocardioides sp.]HSX69010.1 RDD family protein [Nocardioides sp.]
MLETASWLRRIIALFIDWFACVGITVLVLGPLGWTGNADSGFITLGIFVIESWIFLSLMGGTFGHLLARLRVTRIDGSRIDPLRALLRSVLVALVIPPLVFRPDGRGLHDMAAGSVVHDLQVAA